MTNEELFTDLKQFIEATVSQQTAHLATKDDLADVRQNMATKDDITNLRRELKADIKQLDNNLAVVQAAIADTLSHTTEALDTSIQDHEQRLRHLERRAA
jgi:response regulator RpfG family c-di-GMP phosphodiesterase